MSVFYTVTISEEYAGASIIFSDGTIVAVDHKNSSWDKIRVALNAATIDEEALRTLVNPALSVGSALNRLSERVIYDSGTIYFDGDAIDDSIARVIVRILDEGGTSDAYGSLVAFLEKLYQNPSEASRIALYDFLVRYDITILPDGDFIVYKGVQTNGKSVYSGYGIVDGKVFENAQLQNNVGSIVEIPRSMVDANNEHGCSTGLHAGSYEYARGYSRGLLLTVKVNPRDVVSVPDHCTYQKIRVSRYVVLSHTEVKLPEMTRAFNEENDWADDRTALISPEAIAFADAAEDGLEDGVEVSFSYTDARGNVSNVVNFIITDVVRQRNDVLVTGLNSSDDYRSYKFSRMSDIESYELPDTFSGFDMADFVEVQSPMDTELAKSKAMHPSSALSVEEKANFEVAKDAISSDSTLDFNYVDSQGLSSHVVGFTPESVSVKNGGVLITGTTSASEYRSFKASRISELSTVQVSTVIVDKWAAATFAALQEDND